MKDVTNNFLETFPSPLEVDRFISCGENLEDVKAFVFPSPLEVYRFISSNK